MSANAGVLVHANSRPNTTGGGGGVGGKGAGLSGGLTQPAGWQSLLSFTVLFLAWLAGFSARLFAVIRFESIIHEFDPWFNYRSTHHLATNGFYEFLNWFDERAWYPLGRIVGGTNQYVHIGLLTRVSIVSDRRF
ncbi:hypothetical protein NHX12_024142 [Muraenolepis orangiensis]|uniref:dolichyl-diphosphooligosaccharide--protein glycotransferase n=1 Tax=Muraenolepis orangiensis TaxID=630683 RepID=A0A9Q0ENM1_9TELE|nr:hypothetical protein NHX12_024142 [Muraenolepis orangiensis]